MQPAQQQGRRFPSISSVRTLSIWLLRVSCFFTDTTQQIHSLRARGVRSSHIVNALGVEIRALRKSSGTLCTTLAAISPPASLCLPESLRESLRAGFLSI